MGLLDIRVSGRVLVEEYFLDLLPEGITHVGLSDDGTILLTTRVVAGISLSLGESTPILHHIVTVRHWILLKVSFKNNITNYLNV